MGGTPTGIALGLSEGHKGVHQVVKLILCCVCISLSSYSVLSVYVRVWGNKDVLPQYLFFLTAVELQGTGIIKKSLLRRGTAWDSEGSVAVPAGSLQIRHGQKGDGPGERGWLGISITFAE